MRVLVVDDEPNVLELLRLVIATSDDHQVTGTAADTDGAVVLAAQTRPDVIVTDMTLASGPVVDGAYLARLKEAAPGARIVIFSGLPAPADGDLRGADAHLLKPASPAAILEVIEGG
jgi:DNA-binding NarL/FixJ family response regulator